MMMDARIEYRSRIRQKAILRREKTPAKEHRDLSLALAERLEADLSFPSSVTLAGFWAIRGEPDILSALRAFKDRGHRIVLPVTTSSGLIFREPLSFDLSDNPPGLWGVPEPRGPMVAVEEVHTFLVPGLAFDIRGTRLGYGKGYFDRALSQASEGAIYLGAAFSRDILPEIPAEPHDIPMQGLFTEQSVVDCGAARIF